MNAEPQFWAKKSGLCCSNTATVAIKAKQMEVFLILTIMRKKNSPYYNKKRSLSPSLMNLFITFLKDRWLKLNATSWKGCPLKDTGISAQILLKGVSKLIQTMFLEFIQTGNKLTLHLKIMQSNWWNMILHYFALSLILIPC